jgi:phosphatidylglycerophosphate synthase
MLDPILRRHTSRLTAPLAARLERVRPLALTLSAFVAAVVAMVDIGHRNYLWGLGCLILARLFDALDGPRARVEGATPFGAYLDQVLSLVAGAGLAFAFALAEPDRALAAMFLMLGLVARAAAGADAAKTELVIVFGLACLFPNWFSLLAYTFGIVSFLEAGNRVATAAVRSP